MKPLVAHALDAHDAFTSVGAAANSGMSTRVSQPVTEEAALRAAGATGLLAIGLIHFIDFFSKIKETEYLGLLYLVLIVAVLGLGFALISGRRLRTTWLAIGVVAGLTALTYVASRSVGLPAATGDIGNWEEPLGLASLFVEGSVVLMAGWALSAGRRRRAAGAEVR